MSSTSRKLRGRAATAFLLAFLLQPSGSAHSAQPTILKIGPGPKVMSDEERSLVADPAEGAAQGIILIDETARDEWGGTTEIVRHVRAKILGDGARTLADISLPQRRDRGVLKRWWGITILPDGSVLEARQGELKEQKPSTDGKLSFLQTTLPGVVAGCVIDYGYHFQVLGFYDWPRVDIQGEYPVRQFRYLWIPSVGQPVAYRLSHAEGLRIEAARDHRSVLVTGSRLPAAVMDEPFMPPQAESHASVLFYYRDSWQKPDKFWDQQSKRLLRRAGDFAKKGAVKGLVASMHLPEGAGLEARLAAAYDFAAAHYRNASLSMAETTEIAEPRDKQRIAPSRTIADLLNDRAGSSTELDFLFFGIARALGAEASLVAATDRTDHYFDPALLSMGQFDWTLVAVKAPGEPDDRLVFVDLGSGLPYGEIPWWVSDSSAFMATPDGYRSIMLPSSDAPKNLLQTAAQVSFDLDEGTTRMSWSSDGAGQEGLRELWKLRTMSPEDRLKTREEMCGASEEFEVSRSNLSSLDPAAGYHLECAGDLASPRLNRGIERYLFRFRGPYKRDTPRFTAPARALPAVFQYRRIESLVLDIRSPEGFVPAGATPPDPFESPFGRYALFIKATPEGYHLERVLSLTALQVPTAEYEGMKQFFADVALADDTALPFERRDLP